MLERSAIVLLLSRRFLVLVTVPRPFDEAPPIKMETNEAGRNEVLR